MAKFNVQKGDKIRARTPSLGDINNDGNYTKSGGHEEYGKSLTVTKVWNHGVRTSERGYVHNNNILSKDSE